MARRRLTRQERERYDVLPRALADRVWVYEIPALPGSYVGLTLGNHVFLATDVPDDGTSELLAHELVHVRQWWEQGLTGFGRRYLWSFGRGLVTTRSWSASYRAIPAEAEARRLARAWAAKDRRS